MFEIRADGRNTMQTNTTLNIVKSYPFFKVVLNFYSELNGLRLCSVAFYVIINYVTIKVLF